ncbi:hypothetical protein C1645_841372 [Glomus cerebriforme]|uniref:Jacalin-type lectin domain-containing protein n=1 Tax=Glomus cerebriforme TaxID=658196 RepID=A0A397S599_9GLOM|nr:hypothetical protein C1645_841372 [Glomus cerebriforme]
MDSTEMEEETHLAKKVECRIGGEHVVEVNLDDALIKTENIFNKLYNLDLPAYSKFSENRVAVANLANLVNSNDAFDMSKKNIYNDLLQLDDHLNQLSMWLVFIYEVGKIFFLTFEKGFYEWERTNKHDPKLFELIKNKTDDLYFCVSETASKIVTIKKFVPSTKSDLKIYNGSKEMTFSQWINYLDISLWCNTLTIKKCKHELSRVKKIVAFLEYGDFNLTMFTIYFSTYIDELNVIINHLSREKVKVNKATKDLKPLIKIIKSAYMNFLTNQDVIQKGVDLNVGLDVHKSKLIGEVGCREFVAHFTNAPVFQGVSMAKHLPFLRNIKISAGLHIVSLTFEWSDNISFKYGGNGGELSDFNLDKDEVLTWVKIYTDDRGKVSGLEFCTNKWQTTSRLGKSSLALNSTILKAPSGYEIVGLHGGFDRYICGIGILYSKIEMD